MPSCIKKLAGQLILTSGLYRMGVHFIMTRTCGPTSNLTTVQHILQEYRSHESRTCATNCYEVRAGMSHERSGRGVSIFICLSAHITSVYVQSNRIE